MIFFLKQTCHSQTGGRGGGGPYLGKIPKFSRFFFGRRPLETTFLQRMSVQAYGWVALFSTNILLYILLVLYVALAVKEKEQTRKEEKEKSE